MTSNSISIPISIRNQCEKDVETLALIDSGAGGMFIDQQYAEGEGFHIEKLENPITARNVDGTRNKLGTITSYMELPLRINGRTRRTRLLVTGLGKQRIILGFPWLNEQNLDINLGKEQHTRSQRSRETGRYHTRRKGIWIDRRMHPIRKRGGSQQDLCSHD